MPLVWSLECQMTRLTSSHSSRFFSAALHPQRRRPACPTRQVLSQTNWLCTCAGGSLLLPCLPVREVRRAVRSLQKSLLGLTFLVRTCYVIIRVTKSPYPLPPGTRIILLPAITPQVSASRSPRSRSSQKLALASRSSSCNVYLMHANPAIPTHPARLERLEPAQSSGYVVL
jgi:hypothetical protein